MKVEVDRLGYGDYLRFRDLVLNRSGLFFPEKKRTDLEIGLVKAMNSLPQANGDINAYFHFLNDVSTVEARAEMDRLINLLTVGETHFFRDNSQFDALINHVFPALINRKRAEARLEGSASAGMPHLRIWSAGCSSGEEAYSLAIILRELIPDIQNWRILILATDINENSLSKAQKAIYTDWSFRESRALALRPVYFSKEGKNYRLNDDIRQMVTFTRQNLIEDDYPSIHNNLISMDLIMCRNVTIYFTEETTSKLVRKFYKTLNNDGWLVVGHSEPSLITYRDFKAHTFPGTLVYHKTGQPTTIPDNWTFLENEASIQKAWTQPVLQPKVMVSNPETNGTDKHLKWRETKPLPPRRTGFLSLSQSNGTNLADLDPYKAARLLLSMGEIKEAILTLERTLEDFSAKQQPYAYSLLARAYADQGDWNKARQWCEKAIEINTLLPETYALLAMIEEEEENFSQAILNLKKVIYLDRQRPLSHFSLAMLYKKIGREDQYLRGLKNIEKILVQWPEEKIIPDSGGTSARRLLETVRQMIEESNS